MVPANVHPIDMVKTDIDAGAVVTPVPVFVRLAVRNELPHTALTVPPALVLMVSVVKPAVPNSDLLLKLSAEAGLAAIENAMTDKVAIATVRKMRDMCGSLGWRRMALESSDPIGSVACAGYQRLRQSVMQQPHHT